MANNMYCLPEDIAYRLSRRKPYWFHGLPNISLEGNNGSFGRLSFDFKDLIVTFTLYIKDREQILDAAHIAVHNFIKLCEE